LPVHVVKAVLVHLPLLAQVLLTGLALEVVRFLLDLLHLPDIVLPLSLVRLRNVHDRVVLLRRGEHAHQLRLRHPLLVLEVVASRLQHPLPHRLEVLLLLLGGNCAVEFSVLLVCALKH
jgi:hypothetical protein